MTRRESKDPPPSPTSKDPIATRAAQPLRSPKIRDRHLDRLAIVYVRQSTPHQVRENRESRDRQYALLDHAIALGWPREGRFLKSGRFQWEWDWISCPSTDKLDLPSRITATAS
jgi:hypothetical protein